jgi:protoheme IX farnesyltransferase
MKLRVVELLIITTVPALFLAAKGWPPLIETLASLIGGTLAAGAANAYNMVIEADIDKLMLQLVCLLKNRLLGLQLF